MGSLLQNKIFIIGGVVVIIAIAVILFLVLSGGFGGQTNKNVTLQFWGVFDDNAAFQNAISTYQKTHKNINISYRNFNPQDYEAKLIDSFAAGTGPDIWMIHNTWLPKHYDKISPLPQEIQKDTKKAIFTFKDFQDQFVDVTVNDLTSNGQIYALPTYVDTLALFWNKDIFNSKGITSPPSSWDQFNDDVSKITTFDDQSNIILSGAAIGTARNVNRSTDLLSLLFIQSGTQMTRGDSVTFAQSVDNKPVGENTLNYYTNFANPSASLYSWNDKLHYSIDAFQEGTVAMMFNYSHQIKTIRAKAPRLNFGVALSPQVAGSAKDATYASYWAPTVSKFSKNSLEAWKFLAYLSSTEGADKYLSVTGRPAARRDLIEKYRNDPDLGVFEVQALSARSWYQADSQAIETIFANMIDDVNFGRTSVATALKSAESQVSVLMVRAKK